MSIFDFFCDKNVLIYLLSNKTNLSTRNPLEREIIDDAVCFSHNLTKLKDMRETLTFRLTISSEHLSKMDKLLFGVPDTLSWKIFLC